MGKLYAKKAESSGQEGRRVKMDIRGYVSQDCRELAELFYGTVHSVNAGDYTENEIDIRYIPYEKLPKFYGKSSSDVLKWLYNN